MNFKQLIEGGATSRAFDIEFLKPVEDLEGYPEASMRATFISGQLCDDDVAVIRVSYEKFDEYNKAFETANYYARDGVPRLTAREAGHYSVEENLYVMADEPYDKYFKILDSAATNLYDRWRAQRDMSSMTYVQWLESLVVISGV